MKDKMFERIAIYVIDRIISFLYTKYGHSDKKDTINLVMQKIEKKK